MSDKQKLYSIARWMLFIICPILSLPLIIIDVWNNKKDAIWNLILFFCLLAYLFPPAGDLYRYYNSFFIYFSGISYEDIFDFYIFDIVWYSILFVVAKCNLSFQICQVLSCLIQLLIVLYIIKSFNIGNYNRQVIFYVIIGSFLYNGFWVSIELRFFLALSFFNLAIVKFDKGDKIASAIFFVLASTTHLSFAIFSIILLLSLSFKRFINLKVCIIMGIIVFMSISILGIYLSSIGFDKAVYITEKTDWTAQHSLLLYSFRNWLVFIPAIFLLILMFRTDKDNTLKKCSLIFLMLTIATLGFGDLNYRIKYITSSLVWLSFVSSLSSYSINSIRRFCILSIFAFCACSAIYYKALFNGNCYKICQPILVTLNQDSYSDYWIQRHIDDGNIK